MCWKTEDNLQVFSFHHVDLGIEPRAGLCTTLAALLPQLSTGQTHWHTQWHLPSPSQTLSFLSSSAGLELTQPPSHAALPPHRVLPSLVLSFHPLTSLCLCFASTSALPECPQSGPTQVPSLHKAPYSLFSPGLSSGMSTGQGPCAEMNLVESSQLPVSPAP